MLSVMIDDDLTLKKPSRLFLQVMLLGLISFLHGLMDLLRTRKSNEMYFKFALSSFKNSPNTSPKVRSG